MTRPEEGITRRRLLKGMLAGGLALHAAPALASLPPLKPRLLSFENLHTGETLKKVEYYRHGKYLPDALAEINKILRDHRTGEVETMDPKLLDMLHALHGTVHSGSPYRIISGYRSAHSNAMLASRSGEVAKKSLHMQGKAVDITLADRDVGALRRAALSLQLGGVGYYPQSGFVHVDTGRVRQWNGA